MTAKLTPRQAVIAQLVRRKWTSRQIAEKLGISTRTVEVHRANIALRTRRGAAGGIEPLNPQTVQRSVDRLSRRLAKLAAEIDQLRRPRAARKVRYPSPLARSAAINSVASRRV
jgi:hypothetical protein